MEPTLTTILPVFLLIFCALGLAIGLLIAAWVVNPDRPNTVKQAPYESGMDPIHDARRRFDVRFHLLAIAFLVFDVELLFLYPWAVISRPNAEVIAQADINNRAEPISRLGATAGLSGSARNTGGQVSRGVKPSQSNATTPAAPLAFAGAMTFIALLAVGYVYDWRKGVFQWR
jgi:NADH-quinone oxidoreductase subunit A